jgi:hypothetical protein
MAETEQAFNTVAPLRNVVKLSALIQRVKTRSDNLPGMAVFYGPSGFGKSMAGVYSALKFDAITVQVKSVWGKKTLCEAIAREIGLPTKGNTPDLLERICNSLAMSARPLLIDEADFLVQRKMIEIVRDIYEGSGAPIILIGEELMPQKLHAWERVHGRILDWVPAEPGDMSDLGHLARLYVPGVDLDQDLRQKILTASGGSIRRICVNLDRVREFAAVKGLRTVTVNDWGKQAFFSGAAPEVRQFDAARRVG